MLITDSPPPPIQTVNFKPPTNLEAVRLSLLPILFWRFWNELHRVTTRQTEKLVPDSKHKLSDTHKLQHGGTD